MYNISVFHPIVSTFTAFVVGLLPFIDTYASVLCFIDIGLTFRHKHPLSGFGHCGILPLPTYLIRHIFV